MFCQEKKDILHTSGHAQFFFGKGGTVWDGDNNRCLREAGTTIEKGRSVMGSWFSDPQQEAYEKGREEGRQENCVQAFFHEVARDVVDTLGAPPSEYDKAYEAGYQDGQNERP